MQMCCPPQGSGTSLSPLSKGAEHMRALPDTLGIQCWAVVRPRAPSRRRLCSPLAAQLRTLFLPFQFALLPCRGTLRSCACDAVRRNRKARGPVCPRAHMMVTLWLPETWVLHAAQLFSIMHSWEPLQNRIMRKKARHSFNRNSFTH